MGNAIEYAIIMCNGNVIDAPDLPVRIQNANTDESIAPSGAYPNFRGMTMKQIERAVIGARLQEYGGHQAKTAASLGISVRGLRNKIQEYSL